ncbi:MAG: YggS family pyridoxal phosphate-dependent enzyme [Prevotella sp.]|nr:YggS family pyridoxal phosphate-dependent enzyme [Prevotella sp.]
MSMSISQNLQKVSQSLPKGVKLVAVSKFHPEEELLEAYNAGQRVFGESHEQELSRKVKTLPTDIRWHFIGHLQTNKVRFIAPYISLIEAVDSLKLLREIDKQAARCGRVIDVLLELHIAEEVSKYGFTLDACRELLDSGVWRELNNVRICGLMMMASNVDDEQQIRREMMTAADFFDEVKGRWFSTADYFCERSWGMSDDYPIAVECRSTMVRVGTMIFGPRVY